MFSHQNVQSSFRLLHYINLEVETVYILGHRDKIHVNLNKD